jgi:hypothetical protein
LVERERVGAPVGLLDEDLDLVAALEHSVDVLDHDVLHLVDLVLDSLDLVRVGRRVVIILQPPHTNASEHNNLALQQRFVAGAVDKHRPVCVSCVCGVCRAICSRMVRLKASSRPFSRAF